MSKDLKEGKSLASICRKSFASAKALRQHLPGMFKDQQEGRVVAAE